MELVASSESVDVLVDLEAPQIAFTNRTDGEVITRRCGQRFNQ